MAFQLKINNLQTKKNCIAFTKLYIFSSRILFIYHFIFLS